MIQMNLILLSGFEVATIEQLVSYRIARKPGETEEQLNQRIDEVVNSPELISEAVCMCERWNDKRRELGLCEYE